MKLIKDVDDSELAKFFVVNCHGSGSNASTFAGLSALHQSLSGKRTGAVCIFSRFNALLDIYSLTCISLT